MNTNKFIKALICSLLLTSCGTDPQGNKTFAYRNADQWGDIFSNTLKRAAPIVKEEYDSTASK